MVYNESTTHSAKEASMKKGWRVLALAAAVLLLASLVLIESSFRKDAVSHVGAIGPAQVRPEMWSSFCGSSA